MRRRTLTPLATAINICAELSEDDRQTLVDVLRSRSNGDKPKVTATKAAQGKKPKADPSTNMFQELAKQTGKSIEECVTAFNFHGGDRKAALMALTSEG